MLLPILRWVLECALPEVEIESQFACPELLPRGTSRKLVPSILATINYYPCDILFIHRDAEREEYDFREAEIRTALNQLADLGTIANIPVVPVRMSEAWLLIDEAAIRRASGNPNGKTKLSLPSLRDIEKLPNPKATLHALLKSACELNGRRLKSFRADDCTPLVSEWIEDFSLLKKLPAFHRFQRSVDEFCDGYRGRQMTHPAP